MFKTCMDSALQIPGGLTVDILKSPKQLARTESSVRKNELNRGMELGLNQWLAVSVKMPIWHNPKVDFLNIVPFISRINLTLLAKKHLLCQVELSDENYPYFLIS